MNHSCDPNCAITDAGVEIAIRDIEAGEQLTNDYLMMNDPDEAFLCGCDTLVCRRVVRGLDRTHLRPQWDSLIADAMVSFDAVEQPLAELVNMDFVRATLARAPLTASGLRR